MLLSVKFSGFFAFIAVMLMPFSSQALGVLTHEAIVDAAWNSSILPLLKQRYPAATEEDIKLSHAYAYGGAVAPDMGYYPSGSKLFTNLVHYVRSGEMVNALIRNADNLNQFAFALGFLSHYNADNYGHSLATNISVPLLYPKMLSKYGENVTYADDKLSHTRMELGFDVLQVAKGNFASQSYRDYIGFKVDTTVLSKAFKEVYGLDINDIHDQHFFRSVEIFRWVVANVFPLITRQAWATKKKAILEQDSTATAQRFNFKMRQKVYDKNFGTGYKRPGFLPTLFSFLIRVLPKVGPLRPLKFKVPTVAVEKKFAQSFDTIMHHYTMDLKKISGNGQEKKDIDFDTGKPTALCEYTLADETYADLLFALKANNFNQMPFSLKENIETFYKGSKNFSGGKHCIAFWTALSELRGLPGK
ncbi:MAG: zinc dependent phospholipase C family protein [Ferruginibacter sp.]